MAFSISENFDEKPFLLDEERLRGLVGLIHFCLKEGAQIKYNVRREDQTQYSTANIGDILAEKNIKGFRITKLGLSAFGVGRGFEISISFRSGWPNTPIELDITGEDRQLVSTFSADIREYITAEIVARRFHTRWLAVAFVALAAYLFRVGYEPGVLLSHSVNEALNSPDLALKLNYLIERMNQQGGLSDSFAWAGFLVISFAVYLLIFNPQWGVLNPTNLFLIGREHHRYKRLTDLRDKVLWTVVVGSIISTLAGIVVWRLTKP